MGMIDEAGVGVKRAKGQEYECEDEAFQAEYGALYEWMARVLLKGKPRDGASLTVKYKDGGVALCLSASTEGLVGWHQDKTMSEALEGLDKRLAAGKVDWRERKEGWTKR